MLKVIQSPAKYLQGPNASTLLGQYAKNLANIFFMIANEFVMKWAGEKVLNGLNSHNISCHADHFNGECSHAEINRLIAILKQHGCRRVVGIGGGKTLHILRLAQKGIKEGIDEKIQAVAKATWAEGEIIHNMPSPVSAHRVHAAILTADLLGQQWLVQ